MQQARYFFKLDRHQRIIMEEHKQQNDKMASIIHKVLEYGTLRGVFDVLLADIDLDCRSSNNDTVLHSILKNDNLMQRDVISIMTLFFEQGFNPNIKNTFEQTFLYLAVKRRMKSAVDLLFKFRADFNAVNKRGNSIAHFFIEDESSRYEMQNEADKNLQQIQNDGVSFLQFLISKKVDFECRNHEKVSALDLAIDCELLHILPILLDNSRAIMDDNEYDCNIVSKAIRVEMETSVIETLISYYLKYCEDRNLATTLFYKLIDTCKLWSSSETDYFLTILHDLRSLGVNIDNQASQKKLTFTAEEEKDLRLMKFLTESGINFNVEPTHKLAVNLSTKSRHEKPVLHMLAEKMDYVVSDDELRELIFNLLIDHNNEVDEQGKSALQTAIRFGNIKMVKILIQLGVKVNSSDDCMITPLLEALLYVSTMPNVTMEIIDLLVTNGADVNTKDVEGNTPLHLAVSNDYIVQLLLVHGASVSSKNEKQETPLHRAVTIKKTVQVVECLLKNRADVNAKDHRGETPLYFAVSSNNVSATSSLVLHNASVNCKNNYQQTPLHHAVMNDKAEDIVDLLLANGAKVNVKDDKGETPLHLAVCKNNMLIVLLLIEKGASINCKDNRRQTPLHRAVVMDETGEVIDLLLRSGADVNAKDSEGNRPLHVMCKRWKQRNSKRTMEMLLNNGAYLDARNNAGESALFIALSFKNAVLIDGLFKYSVDVNDPKVRELICKAQNEMSPGILQQLIKLKAANLPLDEQYTAYIQDKYDDNSNVIRDFHNKCLKEIKKLKSFFIDKHKTLYDFLHMHPECRGIYVRYLPSELQLLVGSEDLRHEFPIYAVIILASYYEAMIRKTLWRKAERVLFKLFRLPMSVNICILDYLTNVSWFNVIQTHNK